MLITEKDLFIMVFWRNELPKEKVKYISDHFDDFRDSIEFLQDIIKHISDEVKPKKWEELKERIKSINEKNIFYLKKDIIEKVVNHNGLILAAASPDLEPAVKSETFRDKDSHFLVKIFSNPQENKIYIFSDKNNSAKKIKLKINPSGDIFPILDPSKPIVISPKQIINDVTITTQLE